MKTASHSKYQGPGRVVISLGSPRGAPAGFKVYRKLAPTGPMLHMPLEPYRKAFFADILGPLDPQQTVDEIQALVDMVNPPGTEPVLQCFESPPFSEKNWCHRRMVAEWFTRELGISVPEIGYDGPDFVGQKWSGLSESNQRHRVDPDALP